MIRGLRDDSRASNPSVPLHSCSKVAERRTEALEVGFSPLETEGFDRRENCLEVPAEKIVSIQIFTMSHNAKVAEGFSEFTEKIVSKPPILFCHK